METGLTAAVDMREHCNSQSLHSWPELSLQITDQDGEAIAMLQLLVVLEFPIAKGLLQSVP